MADSKPATSSSRDAVPAGSADVSVILKALEFAALKHRDQRRKDAQASPYINHPIALANVLVHEGGVTDPVVIAAALLHDTVEDTETSWQELREAFGEKVAGIVGEVTDDKSLLKAERKRLQVEHAAHISREAKLVKLADKICNVRDVAFHPPAKWDLARRREYFDWAKAVVDRMRGTHAGLELKFDETYALKP
jgi:guanosine-3',5'-bis(diphosphate) 3'-pyrophosphohydrolase